MFIKSILDTDAYTFTISYFYMKNFPNVEGVYEFVDRNKTKYPKGFDNLLRRELFALSSLKLEPEEESFLRRNFSYLPNHYFEWLRGFRFNPSGLLINQDNDGCLSISIEGSLYEKAFWEIAILATVSELYHLVINDKPDYEYVVENTIKKACLAKEYNLKFSDFGTRRRFSFHIQDVVIQQLKEHAGDSFIGTSNVLLAMKYDLKPIGTMAHQVVSTVGAFYGYKQANIKTMDLWEQTFNGELLIYLYDTYSSKPFIEKFDKIKAKLWDGLRVDSGDNYDEFNNNIKLFDNLGVDSSNKTIVFSNSLTMEDAVDLHNYINHRVNDTYGIGTSLMCDCGNNIKPLNIVMKLFKVKKNKQDDNWNNCVKISNDFGKYTGNPNEIQICLKTIGLT